MVYLSLKPSRTTRRQILSRASYLIKILELNRERQRIRRETCKSSCWKTKTLSIPKDVKAKQSTLFQYKHRSLMLQYTWMMTKICQATPMTRRNDLTVCMTFMLVWMAKRRMLRKRNKINIKWLMILSRTKTLNEETMKWKTTCLKMTETLKMQMAWKPKEGLGQTF